jgi:hypothetical protein
LCSRKDQGVPQDGVRVKFRAILWMKSKGGAWARKSRLRFAQAAFDLIYVDPSVRNVP